MATRAFESIPDGLRTAVYNAMGGEGPYSVRQIDQLFRMFGFSDTADVDDVGGVRRTTAEGFQVRIDWGDPDQRNRYLMLVNDVLENYPEVDGKLDERVQNVRRALKLVSLYAPPATSTETEKFENLWPVGTVRVFLSHLARHRTEVHALARVLSVIGFACFVAHDEIRPSRSWQREIERALRSCDVMVAYVTRDFASSDWTDQEVGWALGRDLVVIPVSVDGEMPRGFAGTYQAVRRHKSHTDMSLAREVSKAITDAVFEAQRPAATMVKGRLAALLARAFCRVQSFESARFWYELLASIPETAWTPEMRTLVELAIEENHHLRDAVLKDETRTAIPEAVKALLRRSS